MYESTMKNNNLSDQVLERALIRIEKLVNDGSCRFEAGISDTPDLGKVSSLNQIFKNAVLAVCRAEKIPVDEKALDTNIGYSKDGPLFGGIAVGGYQRSNFKRNFYDRDFAMVFRTAMDAETCREMVVPLRASLAISTPAVKAKALVAA